MPVTDIESIRKLYEKLKAERVVVTWEEFSLKLKYGRTYISRVINGHVPLTPEIINRINNTDFYSTKKVPRETNEVNEPTQSYVSSIDRLLVMLEKEQESVKAEQENLRRAHDIIMVLAGKVTQETNDPPKEQFPPLKTVQPEK